MKRKAFGADEDFFGLIKNEAVQEFRAPGNEFSRDLMKMQREGIETVKNIWG